MISWRTPYPFVSSFRPTRSWCSWPLKPAGKQGVQVYTGRIATGDQFVGSKAQKDDIVARTHPMAVEMEGGSIAHACAINGVPLCHYPAAFRITPMTGRR